MTTIVSFTDFRNDLSKYIDYLKKGNEVIIKNTKKDEELVTLVAKKDEEFDWDEYMKFVRNFKPVFTDKDVEAITKARKATNKRLRDLDW